MKTLGILAVASVLLLLPFIVLSAEIEGFLGVKLGMDYTSMVKAAKESGMIFVQDLTHVVKVPTYAYQSGFISYENTDVTMRLDPRTKKLTSIIIATPPTADFKALGRAAMALVSDWDRAYGPSTTLAKGLDLAGLTRQNFPVQAWLEWKQKGRRILLEGKLSEDSRGQMVVTIAAD